MELNMMKADELERAISAANDERWRCKELYELRCEEQAEDRSMGYVDEDKYDQEVEELEEKEERSSERLCALEDERERRRSLSNHARLAEMHMRGEVPL
jgi:hypothetical protein